MQRFFDLLFLQVNRFRNQILRTILVLNWGVFVLILVGTYAVVTNHSSAMSFFSFARDCGEYALILFILVSIPGIARRFRLSHKLLMIVMMFRRQLGVLCYLFVLMHSMMLGIIPLVVMKLPILTEPVILAGMLAHVLLFALFITSNDWSVKRLGNWWGKIHDAIYIIVWCIFAHVALQSVSVWTVLIGTTAVLQLASHIYAARRLRSLN